MSERRVLGELFPNPYTVLYESDSLLAVSKSAGLPSTGKHLGDPYCLQHILMTDRKQKLWAVHQLDADTTGVILFTPQKQMVKVAKDWLESPATEKRYLAFCHGVPDFSEATARYPIGVRQDERGWGVSEKGKHATSFVRVLGTTETYCLVQVTILTGRTHQIRIHMEALGHPLVGEPWYRTPPCSLHHRQALHAWQLALSSEESTGVLEAPLPDDFRELAVQLGFSSEVWNFLL